MDEVLYQLCRHAVGIMDGWHPYPAWAIAKQAGVSLSTARRRLRKLKEKGLARTFSKMQMKIANIHCRITVGGLQL